MSGKKKGEEAVNGKGEVKTKYMRQEWTQVSGEITGNSNGNKGNRKGQSKGTETEEKRE